MVDVKLVLNLAYNKEELYWKQRARENWLKYGDNNTTFIYQFALQIRWTNRIHRLEDSSGMVVEKDNELEWVAHEYFKLFFTSQGMSNVFEILASASRCITAYMNECLSWDFTSEEVVVALR